MLCITRGPFYTKLEERQIASEKASVIWWLQVWAHLYKERGAPISLLLLVLGSEKCYHLDLEWSMRERLGSQYDIVRK